MGRRLLWAAGVSAHRHPTDWLAVAARVKRRHGALSRRRDRDRESSGTVPPLRRLPRDIGRRADARGRRSRLGHRRHASTALRRGDPQRRRLGRDGRSGGQCDRRTLVRACPAGGPGHRVQRREHRRPDLHAAVGRAHWARRLRRGGDGDWSCDGDHDMDPFSHGVLAPARGRRSSARRRCVGHPVVAGLAAHGATATGRTLWRHEKFLTLAAGMALALFAQIGLLAHLFSILVPVLGADRAGAAMGIAPASASRAARSSAG